MKIVFILIKRNVKLFFKDKGMFFTSLITPAILLVLYAAFLGNIYRDNFTAALPESFSVSSGIVEGLVGSQLISSILSVSCVTVAFCSNFLMVQDKANGTIRDFRISPVKSGVLSIGYYAATLFFHSYHLFCRYGDLPWVCGFRRVVFIRTRCIPFIFGRDAFSVFWSGVILPDQFLFIYTGADFSGRDDHQCWLWLYLRSVYADLFIWGGT